MFFFFFFFFKNPHLVPFVKIKLNLFLSYPGGNLHPNQNLLFERKFLFARYSYKFERNTNRTQNPTFNDVCLRSSSNTILVGRIILRHLAVKKLDAEGTSDCRRRKSDVEAFQETRAHPLGEGTMNGRESGA